MSERITIGRCRECKWWREHGAIHGVRDGECAAAVGVLEFLVPPHDVISVEPMEQQIVTGPDFGCVHWEEKQDD